MSCYFELCVLSFNINNLKIQVISCNMRNIKSRFEFRFQALHFIFAQLLKCTCCLCKHVFCGEQPKRRCLWVNMLCIPFILDFNLYPPIQTPLSSAVARHVMFQSGQWEHFTFTCKDLRVTWGMLENDVVIYFLMRYRLYCNMKKYRSSNQINAVLFCLLTNYYIVL